MKNQYDLVRLISLLGLIFSPVTFAHQSKKLAFSNKAFLGFGEDLPDGSQPRLESFPEDFDVYESEGGDLALYCALCKFRELDSPSANRPFNLDVPK
ncbi:hypothetical protein GW916_11325 [bacterium]|nr:hypothetical protein [bacterium]